MRKKTHAYLNRIRKQPILIAIGLLFTIAAVLFIIRYVAVIHLAKSTDLAAIVRVNIITPKPSAMEEKFVLPGSLLAWHEAPIFARASGYLKEWYVDIGYRVHKGDVLAIIERPELDAQLREAQYYLKVVVAQNELAQLTARRWANLVKTDFVSKQAHDDKRYQAAVLEAEVSKALAKVEKLRAYVSFEQVIAPFSGTISLRQTDIGALINVGSNPSQAKPLFRIVQTDPLRLYVNIPQTYATRIKPNMQVKLRFAEHPGRTFSAQLLKTAGAINPKTLTLQAEFKVNNKQGILLPGSYSVVYFSIPSFPNSMIIPVNALVFRQSGLQVAVVKKNNRIHLKNVVIGTDFGHYVQINSGIQPGERIIINPIDSLYQGQQVQVVDSTVKRV